MPEMPSPGTGRRSGASEGSAVRAEVWRFLAAGLVVLAVIAIPAAFWVRAIAERIALDSILATTQRIADYALGPLATEKLLEQDPASLDRVRETLDPWIDNSHIVRIKMWTADGRIVYSDQAELIGRTYELEGWAQGLLAGGPGQATFEAQGGAENTYEAGRGELVEVYVTSSSPSGVPLIFEAYFDDKVVRDIQGKVLAGVAPAFLLALAALQLALLVPAVRLARRVNEHQEARRQALQHAVEASELERARIARDLHDDVIQDLAGLSYALEAEEPGDGAGGLRTLAPAREIVQGSIRTLREITGKLYSPELDSDSLPEALGLLVDPLAARGIHATLRLEGHPRLAPRQATMLYRVAREALANVTKHALADTVLMVLATDGRHTALIVRDNGQGFDAAQGAPQGHLGLRIMRDTAATVGGTVDIQSWPGAGTTVTATVAAGSPRPKPPAPVPRQP
ncbi:sensor histidine kinase [Zafaria cholistanensis]|nr:sensor histidine kinase [Zafaria cholistanensis]